MAKQRQNGFKRLALLVFAVVIAAAPIAAWTAKDGGSSIVVLTASWCGSCREIIPMVNDVASSSGLPMVTLDVDKTNAPDEAGKYGIAVNGGDLPEVYLYKNGKTTLLFNGRGYRIGQSAQAKSQIQGKLQSSL